MAVMELYSGLSGSDGVAHFAHLGGAAAGFLLLKYGDKLGIFDALNKLFSRNTVNDYDYKPPEKEAKVFSVNWVKKEEKKVAEEPVSRSINIDGEEITQTKIDDILDKISDTGYQNLSEKEKRWNKKKQKLKRKATITAHLKSLFWKD